MIQSDKMETFHAGFHAEGTRNLRFPPRYDPVTGGIEPPRRRGRQVFRFLFSELGVLGDLAVRLCLRQSPDAAPDVKQQAGIAQDLELLADFIADVTVVGMQPFQFAGEGVGVGGGEGVGRDIALRCHRR